MALDEELYVLVIDHCVYLITRPNGPDLEAEDDNRVDNLGTDTPIVKIVFVFS